MEKKALALALLVSVALLLRAPQPATAQVFCRSQFNLANEACSMRNFIPGGPGVRRGVLPRLQQQLNETAVVEQQLNETAVVEQQHRSDDDEDNNESGGSGRSRRSSRHRHQHQHRHSEEGGEEDPRDTACCRRLMGLDNSCVCQATARLPAFMNSVRHSITLTPIDGCEISFDCPGPLF
ncbi:hypothetical protein SEVIR_6G135000v4 [Setaria viridis]|uniref:Bifunctional inhibitor/plant lipid transfer protein/seed storage helical domain-containing protein n=3 Tax=Setaria TaxID=4554 RepID=A0A368RKX1_SETIT|nr:uncharacterized protein LOC101773007 [Setaria italica]XP_034601427.1 uncharacterized protein LOC117862026 [Setaria viridis]RCV30802.1 hypothetical protein SETIT_6G125100v2 [Setaria italica]TKW09944.1 hypothetical protein SEVIR_6G135000v2 [Setaria viridis]